MFEYETKTRTDFPTPKYMTLEYDYMPTIPDDRTLYLGDAVYGITSVTKESSVVGANIKIELKLTR